MENILTVKNLNIVFDGKKILENISFSVEKGDFLVIFGENGSGKSSLIKTLLGLRAPQKGGIYFGGGIHSYDIGYLPQAAAMQHDFPASVKEVVMSGCLNKIGKSPFYGKKEKLIASKSMRQLGIYDRRNDPYSTLSGGQQQRTLLARALCAADKMILLDEPVSGLDPAAAAEFYETICKVNKNGTAVIMVSHDVHAALSIAKHVLHIGNHSALFFGTPAEYEKSTFTEEGF